MLFFARTNLISYVFLCKGVRRDQNGLNEYLIEFKDGFPNKIVSSATATQNWPALLVEFLEKHTYFSVGTKEVSFDKLVEASSTFGDPIRVKCEYFQVMFRISNHNQKILTSNFVLQMFPTLLANICIGLNGHSKSENSCQARRHQLNGLI